MKNIVLKNIDSTVILSGENGSILSYQIHGREMCAKGGENRPLFTIKRLDEKGAAQRYTSLETSKMEVDSSEERCELRFIDLAQAGIDCTVTIRYRENDLFSWNIVVESRTDMVMEWVEFPQITVPEDLKGKGGNSQIFWPALEGILIDDISLRESSEWLRYKEITGQSAGYCGFYPGSCPMQFMAYYDDEQGLYFAAHDRFRNPKTVEFHRNDDGVALEFRTFCNGATKKYEMNFDMVTASVKGDWYDAAELYRSWMEAHTEMPSKIRDNAGIPKWMSESPVVVLYPIRGTIDHGDMTPNLYYPYKNILPLTEDFGQKMDSRIMALPMHWEGTAPWATPYVWPPYGGEEEFTEFVEDLHRQGNLAGVYCSGIGWTTKSFLDPSLDFSDRYDETLMCRTPEGKIEQSKVIGAPIRLGYDMCPYSDKVDEIVVGEIASIAGSGCDYAQYFDQNLGGESSFCYARDHGHPASPGIWQNESMIRIFRNAYKKLNEMKSEMVIGCEGAASEPFIGYLPFNDLRYNMGYFYGKPVPAYGYVFHEYLNNFMGNQNTIHDAFNLKENPDCLLFRLAYSFAAGDLFTLALGNHGLVHWGWDVTWDVETPEQEPIFELIRNLNQWRRTYREFLHEGKMIKPIPLEKTGIFNMTRPDGSILQYPSLLTSRWKSANGAEKQVIVNYLRWEQDCHMDGMELRIPALSALWIE